MHGVWFTGRRILTHDPYEMTHSTYQPIACSDFHNVSTPDSGIFYGLPVANEVRNSSLQRVDQLPQLETTF